MTMVVAEVNPTTNQVSQVAFHKDGIDPTENTGPGNKGTWMKLLYDNVCMWLFSCT